MSPVQRNSITMAAVAHYHRGLNYFATTCRCMPPCTYFYSNHWNVLGGQIIGNFGPAAYHLRAVIAVIDAPSSTLWWYMLLHILLTL